MSRNLARPGMPNGDRAIIAALATVLILIGALVVNAVAAERTQRDLADGALRQLSATASWQYAQRVTADIAHSTRMTMLPVLDLRIASPNTPIPAADALLDRRVVRGPICPLPIQPIGFALLDLRSREVRLSGQGWLPGDDDRVRALLATMPNASPDAMDEMLGQHAESAFLVLEGNGRTRADVLLTAIARTVDHQPVAVYAVLAHTEAVGGLLGDVMRRSSWLPPNIARGRPTDSLLALAATTSGGASIVAPPAPGSHGSETPLGAGAGQLRIDVALLPPAVAAVSMPRLVALGSPLLVSVFLLAATLMVLAFALSRRRSELARTRSDFVAGVSHELHAPLALIRAHAETLMLEREESPDERRRFLEIVLRESARLTRLVDGILGFSPTTTPMVVEAVELAPIVRSVAADFSLAASASGSRIEAHVSRDACVCGDPEAIRRVLINLVDNAVKHGPERQTIRIAVATTGAQTEITIDDQGRAIAPSERERVFDRYVRLESSDGRARRGSGIGLAVVRDLCRNQSGDVTLETAPGGGTRVRVVLATAERNGDSQHPGAVNMNPAVMTEPASKSRSSALV